MLKSYNTEYCWGKRLSMEILNNASDLRSVLAILDQTPSASSFRELLSSMFRLAVVNSIEEALRVMHERSADLSAVIVDVEMAKANDFAFLRKASTEMLFNTIPVIVAARREPTDDDMRCLDEGAIDFLVEPCNPAIVKRRIENAIHLKSSSTFFEIATILRELPSTIFLKDAEGRYVFSTHYQRHLIMDDDPNWTIRGKTDLDIRKDRENALKAMEADREIIRSGKGTSYIIEENYEGKQEFLELIKRPVFDGEGNAIGIIALINNVTETELLRRELEKRSHTDELTGLENRRSFDEALRDIMHDDAFPIGVISIDCDGLKRINDTLGHQAGDSYIRISATAFKSALPFEVKAYRVGGDEFIALLPNTSQEEAETIARQVQRNAEMFSLDGKAVSVSCGASTIEDLNDNILEALARADRNMYNDKAARKQARQ